MSDAESGWPDSDLESVDHCAVCGSKDLRAHYSGLIDHDEGVAGSWSMSLCGDCGSLLLDPRPVPQALPRAYGTYYTHSAPDAENSVLEADGLMAGIARAYLKRRFGLHAGKEVSGFAFMVTLAWPLRQQLDYFMRHLPKPAGRLLDIGCGSGGFLVRASMAGWQVTGVEPDPAAAAIAHSQLLGKVHASLDELDDEGFDVVTLAHVVEHLYDPRVMLARCLGVLRPGGQVWLATPNIGSLGHRFYRDAWQPLETPRHLVMPSAEYLCRMMTEVGFIDVEILRRGRGSKKRLFASALRARRMGRRRAPSKLLSVLIDTAASVFPRAAEELVVVGRKPD